MVEASDLGAALFWPDGFTGHAVEKEIWEPGITYALTTHTCPTTHLDQRFSTDADHTHDDVVNAASARVDAGHSPGSPWPQSARLLPRSASP